jgi:hypothetical protein
MSPQDMKRPALPAGFRRFFLQDGFVRVASTDETRLIPPRDFAPLALAADDRLPTDIELVLAYRYAISPDCCADTLARGLRTFPHLTGTAGETDHPHGMIVPSARGTALEVVESTGAFAIGDLEELALQEHSARFIPHDGDGLFRARLTLMPAAGLSILGLRVSHMAVDGTGLAWFLSHCTAHLRGVEPDPVFHERSHGFGNCLAGPDEAPHRYRDAGVPAFNMSWADDAAATTTPVVFDIDSDAVRSCLNASSVLDARLRLGAWLCTETAARHPAFTEVALWCDPRGMNGIPAGYTGNAGCYLHFPLREGLTKELTHQLRNMATRGGFQQIADTYRRIKRAEAIGRTVVWDGPGTGVLQLNLVPHAVAGADFGMGVPALGLLLTRNSSGLRISLTTDGSRFLVEACLPAGVGASLVGACRASGLHPSVWCCGRKMLECP